ncbi:MAG: nucleotidyl transferase AbiEii/AbiGii toxin family protein [Candidatus Liptonbacteria bacterium]|nr:nucleotidyl transferase AbiEii/AbiGii toxin family protein [Candidatus Liptonbacteria bacterium]
MAILSENQRAILSLIAGDMALAERFYLTGGTALAEYYLQHRLSEDLDFFSEEEFEPQAISAFFKKIQKKAGIQSVAYEQSFNRNLFFLDIGNDRLKTEFTYFPFERIERGKKMGGLDIDSLRDIAVNKLFTIVQKPRSRDFIDLYCILQKEQGWNIDELAAKARIKFEAFDMLQLSAQFLRAETLKDRPTMVRKIPDAEWESFFKKEAKRIVEAQLD